MHNQNGCGKIGPRKILDNWIGNLQPETGGKPPFPVVGGVAQPRGYPAPKREVVYHGGTPSRDRAPLT
ncbi:MAG: hypothetical protein QW100_02200 [Thermoplasmatales archaeon]